MTGLIVAAVASFVAAAVAGVARAIRFADPGEDQP